ncbi:MAG: GAF domain-containing protein [Nitriliruptorales bacterium]|nr:GAF domain-containing protein [Nitriliruptorales bacterium]
MTEQQSLAARAHQARSAEERLERLLEVQQLLFRVSRAIGPALELQPVLHAILDAMRELVEFKGGSICLVEGGFIRLVVSDPPVSQEVKDLRLSRRQGLSGHIVTTGEPLYSPNIREDERVSEAVAGLGSNATIRSYIGVPLIVLGEVIGLLQVDSAEIDAFTEDDLYVLEGLGTLVAGAIESARRYEAVVELERLKSDFIERVSHELRTPIAIMSGFTSTLTHHEEDLSDEERRTFLDRIGKATGRLRYLIEEVLTLTSLDSGLSQPNPEDLRLHQVVSDVARGTSKTELVEVDIDPSLEITTDPSVLSRILLALVDNAVKYAGGCTVHAARRGSSTVIDVDDEGPGVDPQIRERIFERFVRGRHTVAGMGVGLPIARHLADTIGASVEYIEQSEGSRFRLTLPDLTATATDLAGAEIDPQTVSVGSDTGEHELDTPQSP